MEAYISTITAYGCSFTLRAWGACNGTIMSYNQNEALATLLGTAFGGIEKASFGLPDLRGRMPMGMGEGPGLDPRVRGQTGGAQHVTLTNQNLPTHNHNVDIRATTNPATTVLPVSTDTATLQNPDGTYLAVTTGLVKDYVATLSNPPGSMGPIVLPSQEVRVNGATDPAGDGEAVATESPFQALNYQIAMFGLYPSRS